MKHLPRTNLVGWSLLLLTMGMTPGALPGQTPEGTPEGTPERTPQQTTNSPAPVAPSAATPAPATPVAPASPDEEGGWRLELPLEQIGDAVRSIDSTMDRAEIDRAVQQELRDNLAGLNDCGRRWK